MMCDINVVFPAVVRVAVLGVSLVVSGVRVVVLGVIFISCCHVCGVVADWHGVITGFYNDSWLTWFPWAATIAAVYK